MGDFIGGFSTFLDILNVLVAEFYEVIHAIEKAKKINFSCMWLECDSILVCYIYYYN